MKPELRRFGAGQHPVVVIDEFSGNPELVASLADSLAPFPREQRSFYPGVRRMIREADVDAFAYMRKVCQESAQFIAGAFGFDHFRLLSGSFSIVTTQPGQLIEPQRFPHFDSTDRKYLALLHYLRVPENSGTAFYRQRSTGIEQVSDANHESFVSAAQTEVKLLPDVSYIDGSNEFFEQIDAVEAVPDRLVIYQGSLLHSGIIPAGMTLSANPREGRLTANIFVQGQ